MASKRADITLANSSNTQARISKYHRKDSIVLYPPIETSRFQKEIHNNSILNSFSLQEKEAKK